MCTVCMDEQTVSARIAGNPVCEDCIHVGIIPKFIAAINHEAEYPPTWGRYRLHPRQFKDYMTDSADFLAQYAKKELEYGTPIKERLYCGTCGAFCCYKDKHRSVCLACLECNAIICNSCGVSDNHDGTHKCEKSGDPFEGMVKGKDVQSCPNPSCGLSVELKDGCNAMHCVSSSCGWSFCFLCGERAEHDSNHWKAGSKCPRWNQADSQNAQFDHPEPANQQDDEQRVALEDLIGRPDDVLQDNAAVPDIIAEVDRFDLTNLAETLHVMRRVATIIRAPLPQVPRHDTILARMNAEANMTADLEATPMATLLRHHGEQLTADRHVAEAMIREHETQHRDVPAFLPAAVGLFIKLRLNLDMYVYRERLFAGLQHYTRRHHDIDRASDRSHLVLFAQHFPMAVRVLYTYRLVAEFRIRAAQDEAIAIAVRGGGAEFLRLVRGEW